MAQGRYVSHHKAKLVTNDTISYGGIALGTETFEFSCFGQISSIKYKLFAHWWWLSRYVGLLCGMAHASGPGATLVSRWEIGWASQETRSSETRTAFPINKEEKTVRLTSDGFEIQSFRTLLAELATRCRNKCRLNHDHTAPAFYQVTEATHLQKRAFELLGLFPVKWNPFTAHSLLNQ